MKENKEDPHTVLKRTYECIYIQFWNVLFGTLQAFATFERKKENVYREETTFCNSQKSLRSLEYMRRESSSSQNRKAGHSLSLSHTHTHTHRTTCFSPVVVRVTSLCRVASNAVYQVIFEVLNFRVLSKLNFRRNLFSQMTHVDTYKGVASQHKKYENCENLVPRK